MQIKRLKFFIRLLSVALFCSCTQLKVIEKGVDPIFIYHPDQDSQTLVFKTKPVSTQSKNEFWKVQSFENPLKTQLMHQNKKILNKFLLDKIKVRPTHFDEDKVKPLFTYGP